MATANFIGTTLQDPNDSTWTHSYTNPAGGDLLLFAIHRKFDAIVTSATYGGVSLIQLESETSQDFPSVDLWGIPAADQPAEESAHDLVVNFSESGSNIGITSFIKVSGVDSGYLGDITTIPTANSTANLTIDITPAESENLILGYITHRDAPSLTADFTEIYFNVWESPRVAGAQSREYNSTDPATISWSNANFNNRSILAIAIPSSDGGVTKTVTADTTLGNWVDETAGTTDLFDGLADDSDSTYIESAATPEFGDEYVATLASPDSGKTIDTTEDVTLNVRYSRAEAGAGDLSVRWHLRSNAVDIVTRTFTAVSDTIAEDNYTLSTQEKSDLQAAINNEQTLQIVFEADL